MTINSKKLSRCESEKYGDFKVLLADDNELNTYVISNQIKKIWTKASVSTVRDGLNAIEMIKHNNFDIILMDLQMPIMTGYEATEKIRKMNSPINRVPIIALSAGIVKPEELEKAGFTDFLLKPFMLRELEEKMNPYLKIINEGKNK